MLKHSEPGVPLPEHSQRQLLDLLYLGHRVCTLLKTQNFLV